MATFTKFDSFVEEIAEGKHDLGTATLIVALTASTPLVTDDVLADLTQISYTNLSSRILTTASSNQTAGLYKLVVNDLVLTASGGSVATFRYITVYDDSSTGDLLVGFYDRGSNVTLADGESLTLDFDNVNGLLTLQ